MRHLTRCAPLESIAEQLVTQTELGEKGRAQGSGLLRGGGQGPGGLHLVVPELWVPWHPQAGLCLGVLATLAPVVTALRGGGVRKTPGVGQSRD